MCTCVWAQKCHRVCVRRSEDNQPGKGLGSAAWTAAAPLPMEPALCSETGLRFVASAGKLLTAQPRLAATSQLSYFVDYLKFVELAWTFRIKKEMRVGGGKGGGGREGGGRLVSVAVFTAEGSRVAPEAWVLGPQTGN